MKEREVRNPESERRGGERGCHAFVFCFVLGSCKKSCPAPHHTNKRESIAPASFQGDGEAETERMRVVRDHWGSSFWDFPCP